jgi:hypothetical protein
MKLKSLLFLIVIMLAMFVIMKPRMEKVDKIIQERNHVIRHIVK